MALSVALVGPLLWRAGLPVARDAVFAPSPPWTWQLLGVGGAAPRAVPVDALVTWGTHVVGADLVARLALVGPLVIAGCAAHRLVDRFGPAARLFATSLAILSPLTVERLALGQWALLWTWAALWLYPLVWQRARDRSRAGVVALILVAALGSITPSGGLMMFVVALAVATVGPGRRRWLVPACVLALQAPWIVAGLVGGSDQAIDPRSFTVFAFHDETGWGAPWGHLITSLSLGGLWDTSSVPGSREGVMVVVVSLVLSVLALCGVASVRRLAPALFDRWLVVGLGGLLLALLPVVPGGRSLLEDLADVVPGIGLLRDGQKWILPFAVLMVSCAAAGVGVLVGRVRDTGLAAVLCVVAALAPWWMLPDGPTTVHRTLAPVTYPDGFARAAQIVEAGGPGDLVTLPWRSYRVFTWANPVGTYDPAGRWFASPVVTDDRLVIDEVTLDGESPRVAELTPLVTAEVVDGAALAAAGVRWVLVYVDDPLADDLTIDDAIMRHEDSALRLYEVTGAVEVVPTGDRVAVIAAWWVGATVLVGTAGAGIVRVRGIRNA